MVKSDVLEVSLAVKLMATPLHTYNVRFVRRKATMDPKPSAFWYSSLSNIVLKMVGWLAVVHHLMMPIR